MVGRRLLVVSLLGLACTDAPATPNDSKPADPAAADAHAGPDRLANLEQRAFPLLVWAAYRVELEYFDPTRFDPQAQLLSAVRMLGLHTPEFFGQLDGDGDTLRVKVRSQTATFELADVTTPQLAADRLEEILVFTQEVLDLDAEPLHELEYAAINGLFAPLDPHTVLLSPDEHNDLGVRTRGHFGGVGAQIRAENRRIAIVRVLPGMPAEKAGVRAGDILLTIDGAATVNMAVEDAQARLRGPVGEVVQVTVRREKQTLAFDIERDTIRIDSVESALLPGDVAYLRISTFQEDTGAKVAQALEELAGAGAEATGRGVILDLRGNSGGLLAQATAVVDTLVQRGELVIVRSADGQEVEQATEALSLAEQKPVVVLVDEDSASAAEIVSGGVQALGRGVVLGRSSFGKGTVQLVKPASPYGRELALKMTVAEYRVAGDRGIQTLGVLPDVELLPVELSSIPGIARYYDEERFERQRERSRTAHLPSAKHDPKIPADRKAKARVRYLWTTELPDDLPLADAEPDVVDRLRDPEIRLARELVLGLCEAADGGPGDAEQRTAALREATRRLDDAQRERIAEQLADSKIDWSAGDGTTGDLVATLSMATKKKEAIAAGEPFSVRLSVENRGTTRVGRVHGITDCVHDELDGIEVLIGSLAPGQKVTRTLELHVMPWHSDFTDELAVDLHVGEPDPKPDARAELRFDVAGAPRPALAYDWWIVDDPSLVSAAPKRPEPEPGTRPSDVPPFSVVGNGDGMLAPGERVLLAFVARNEGKGDSPDVRAVLRNHSAEQGLLEEGAVTLGRLAPGQQATGAFGITVNDDADPSLPFEVELMIGDAQARTRASDELRLRVLPKAEPFVAARETLTIGDEPVRVYNGAHASAPIVVELPTGATVEAMGRVGVWRVIEEPSRGRRLFVPRDLGTAAPAPGAPLPEDPLAKWPRPPLVLPPQLEVEAVPRVTSQPTVTLRGIASHPHRVRDVAVLVRPPGPAQLDDKVHYAANGKRRGRQAQSLSFEAEVPLAPGGNRITILARDGKKVEQRRDLWVYRE